MPDKTNGVPRHVAIIMDGNGRWAQRRGLARIKGHEQGAESVRAAIRAAKKLGVEYLTLYAFSVQNWIRPQDEVSALMKLLKRYLSEKLYEFHENKIRFRAIGRLHDLPKVVQEEIARVTEETSHYTEGNLILALSYGGRDELVDAMKAIGHEVKDGTLDPDQIDEDAIKKHLYAPDVPDPDLMIRTSGEMRISNFLLWQLSYAEFYITDVHWPDFREEHFEEAIEAFKQRHRRFGDVK